MKEEVTDGARVAKKWAESRWTAFRNESPYFQAKVALAVAYVVVVLFTIILAPPRGANWSVSQERIPFGLAFKTALLVNNLRNGDINDVTIEVRGEGIEFDGKKVPGVWHTKPLTLVEGLPTKVLTEQLFDDQGANPPYSLEIDEARVLDAKRRTVISFSHPKQTGSAQ